MNEKERKARNFAAFEECCKAIIACGKEAKKLTETMAETNKIFKK
jgi:hypothetical protein